MNGTHKFSTNRTDIDVFYDESCANSHVENFTLNGLKFSLRVLECTESRLNVTFGRTRFRTFRRAEKRAGEVATVIFLLCTTSVRNLRMQCIYHNVAFREVPYNIRKYTNIKIVYTDACGKQICSE